MTFEVYLNNLLKGSPPPTSQGLQYYPVMPPNAPNTPSSYCVYFVIGSPPIYTQEQGDGGTRVWVYRFEFYAPSFAQAVNNAASATKFLSEYRDAPFVGIQRAFEVNTLDQPTTATGRTFCRIVEISFAENLPS
jgi:hypothetical protein